MSVVDDAHEHQQDAAASRVKDQTEPRLRKIALLRGDNMVSADTPERVAARIDRLSRYYADVRPIDPVAIAAQDEDAVKGVGAVLERIINTNDLLDVRYLDGGATAERSVGRVDIRDERARLVGYGTGSLVSPELLLTNHHVLPDGPTAAASGIEFNYQDGLDGRPMQPKLFAFDPKRFFLTDEALDFTLIAMAAPASELVAFGFNRLIAAEGKAIVGDFVSIIQHPGGEKKQVALRENRIVLVLETFLHYETDTEPGSSGSPVFNDQWEFVALHHASVPAPDHTELGGIVNEGIRVSRLLAFIQAQAFTSAEQPLVDALIAAGESSPAVPRVGAPAPPMAAPHIGQQAVSVTVPLEITLSAAGLGPSSADILTEGITIDPDYADRKGYDETFLGDGPAVVALPTLPEELVALAAINTQAGTEPPYILPYHHFSVVLNKDRRLAFFTAVNIDGVSGIRLKREADRWSFDPRVPQDEQTGENVYADNDLDRGHLVRRLDPTWGPTPEEAKVCNDDTFHFTNCTPQHKDFNELQTYWAGLEDYILENADNLKFRVNVFSGPVFADDDQEYRGVQLPRQFWKVVVMLKNTGELSTTAYLLSQEELIKGLELVPEEFSYGAYRTYQVPIRQVEGLTGLSFGPLADSDPLERQEIAAYRTIEIGRLEDIRL